MVLWQLEEVTDLQAVEAREGLGKRVRRSESMDRDPFDLAAEDLDPSAVLVIHTHQDGCNSGHRFVVLCEGPAQRNDLLAKLKGLTEQARCRREARLHPGSCSCSCVVREGW